jgi:hypothetical protein
MNIPNHIHFGLGFGFKYQYLLSTLLHALMTGNSLLSDKNKNKACQNYMIKKLAKNPDIHANVPIFMKKIKKIFPDIESLNYKKDALILLEGEDGCFEDINLFTTHNEVSKINFIQVKGSDSDSAKYSLEKAIRKTLNSMLKNDNTMISFDLIILINEEVTSWYYLNNLDDRIKMINTVLEPFMRNIKISASLKTKIITVFDEYLNEIYLNGKEKDVFEYFKMKVTTKQYEKIEPILQENDEFILNIFKKLCMIVEHTKVIDKLDHRLIYLFLKYHYGNDKLTKILWNIEMKSMSGHDMKIDDMQKKLEKINFDDSLISNMIFTKNSRKTTFKKGKIL